MRKFASFTKLGPQTWHDYQILNMHTTTTIQLLFANSLLHAVKGRHSLIYSTELSPLEEKRSLCITPFNYCLHVDVWSFAYRWTGAKRLCEIQVISVLFLQLDQFPNDTNCCTAITKRALRGLLHTLNSYILWRSLLCRFNGDILKISKAPFLS